MDNEMSEFILKRHQKKILESYFLKLTRTAPSIVFIDEIDAIATKRPLQRLLKLTWQHLRTKLAI